MSWKVFLTLLVTILFTPLAVGAQTTVYVVNMQQVINESRLGQSAREKVESQIKTKESELEKQRDELRKLSADIQRQAAVLSADALAERQENLKRKERDFSIKYQDHRSEIARQNESELTRVIETIRGVIRELAQKNNYEIILDHDARFVVHASSERDLTPEVIKMVNQVKSK
jgi:outer membrane protein